MLLGFLHIFKWADCCVCQLTIRLGLTIFFQEQRKEKGEVVDGEGHLGYKTWPREMAKVGKTASSSCTSPTS